MGKFLALIKNWLRGFRGNGSGGGGAVAAEPERLPAETPGQNSSIKKIALIVGHGYGDSGAVGSGTNEFEYNSWVAEYVKSNLAGKSIEVFYRGASGIVGVAMRAAGFKPDLCVELHLNSTKGATGCEVLVLKGDKKSESFGRSFANAFTQTYSRRLRQDKGIKWIESSDRGYSSLKAQAVIPNKILVEPFFIDTLGEFVPREDYAHFLLRWVRGL
jgi:N-acetylmuramoyl-L-alanine amidase